MASVLSIAGSDSSGGAGIQADIKTIAAHKLFAQTAITALTAQNTLGVTGVFDASPDFVEEQIDVVFADMRPDAVKIGMISSGNIARSIARALVRNAACNIVLDPVMVATSGSALMATEAVDVMVECLFPLVSVITPNIPEAEVLSGMQIAVADDMERAAQAIHAKMREEAYVLVKGGHSVNDANDVLWGPAGAIWLRGQRVETTSTHGTGCTLSSAIACNLALGYSVEEAVRNAKEYLTGALSHDLHMGKGNGPLDHMWAYR
ncbi:MAG: bifunctional hydroxymethylpyrimidine kinase/phosphomethylpyrimidine kinase [Eggerthellaceae bacterium]|nr:bifunctional hydroxymethylpyrimidine kinase/phosphomethylpyrimidine kinase [Eggerthellaceae bacterium]